jgi:hypothetical protein
MGFAVAAGTDLDRNYTPKLVWTMSLACTDTAAEPCSAPSVVAAQPTLQQPVMVRWSRTTPIRYCGATDYADENGDPGGSGSQPSNGCSAERPAP